MRCDAWSLIVGESIARVGYGLANGFVEFSLAFVEGLLGVFLHHFLCSVDYFLLGKFNRYVCAVFSIFGTHHTFAHHCASRHGLYGDGLQAVFGFLVEFVVDIAAEAFGELLPIL